MQGISRGKFSIDLAILIAGPLARYIGIIADEQDIKYDMGLNDENRVVITPTSLKLALGIFDDDDEEDPDEIVEEAVTNSEGGLMATPTDAETASEEEQAAMLGLSTDEEEEEPVDGLA